MKNVAHAAQGNGSSRDWFMKKIQGLWTYIHPLGHKLTSRFLKDITLTPVYVHVKGAGWVPRVTFKDANKKGNDLCLSSEQHRGNE